MSKEIESFNDFVSEKAKEPKKEQKGPGKWEEEFGGKADSAKLKKAIKDGKIKIRN